MLLLAWIASWIVLFCTGHTWGAWLDLGVGVGIWALIAATTVGAAAYLVNKVRRS